MTLETDERVRGWRDVEACSTVSLISPSRVREGRNWHLTATVDSAWLPWRRRACPSATLDKESVFSCPRTISKQPVVNQGHISVHIHTVMARAGMGPRPPARQLTQVAKSPILIAMRALAVHDLRGELGRLPPRSTKSSAVRFRLGQALEIVAARSFTRSTSTRAKKSGADSPG